MSQTSDFTPEKNLYGLSLFWREATYHFAFWDKLSHLDWDGEYIKLMPEVAKADTKERYFLLLKKFSALLKDGHTDIRWGDLASYPLDRPEADVLKVGDKIVVQQAYGEYASQIPVGSEVIEVDGVPIAKAIDNYMDTYMANHNEASVPIKASRFALAGPSGSIAAVKMIAPGEEDPFILRMPRYARSIASPAVKRPTLQFEQFAGGVVYCAINSFMDTHMLKEFESKMEELARAKGVIFDLRRNPGGNGDDAFSILQKLTKKKIYSSCCRTPIHDAALTAEETDWGKGTRMRHERIIEPDVWEGSGELAHIPIVMLISAETESAAEDMVSAADYSGVATLIGEATSGSTGNSLLFPLPYGLWGQICVKWDAYPDGREFVGCGVKPHILVKNTVEDICLGVDRVLETAIHFLKESLLKSERREPTDADKD